MINHRQLLSKTMLLRPYQEKDFHALRGAFRGGAKSILFVAPTGYGKTVLFSHIAKNAFERGKRVMILCHRAELIEQIEKSLIAVGIAPGIVAPNRECSNKHVVVASVWTLINRLYAFDPPDLLVVDEAHHATSKTTWGKILKHWPNAHRLGVTATPIRLSGEGLDDLFDTMVLGPSTQELIELGFLTPVRVFAPSQPDLKGVHKRGGDYAIGELEQALAKSSVTGDAITHYKRLCAGKRAIAFCVSVEHARTISDAFNKAGIKSESIDGSLDYQERRRRISDFRQGITMVLSSCDLVSEGFDLPAIEVGISLRPTASVGLWLQQVGRCLRTTEGKTTAIILDHAGNTLRHGLPTDEREWSLTGTEKKKRSAQEAIAGVKVCKSCFQACPSVAVSCSGCGTPFPIKARKLEEREGELEEVKAGQQRRKSEQKHASSLIGLIELGKMRGYKNPRAWAEHVMRGRQNKKVRFV
jgi:superfamily II DNA or RNA helicase